MENTKPPYYRIVSVEHQVLGKAQEELLALANSYERQHTVLHRSYTMAMRGNGFVLSILFCCATEPGETAASY